MNIARTVGDFGTEFIKTGMAKTGLRRRSLANVVTGERIPGTAVALGQEDLAFDPSNEFNDEEKKAAEKNGPFFMLELLETNLKKLIDEYSSNDRFKDSKQFVEPSLKIKKLVKKVSKLLIIIDTVFPDIAPGPGAIGPMFDPNYDWGLLKSLASSWHMRRLLFDDFQHANNAPSDETWQLDKLVSRDPRMPRDRPRAFKWWWKYLYNKLMELFPVGGNLKLFPEARVESGTEQEGVDNYAIFKNLLKDFKLFVSTTRKTLHEYFYVDDPRAARPDEKPPPKPKVRPHDNGVFLDGGRKKKRRRKTNKKKLKQKGKKRTRRMRNHKKRKSRKKKKKKRSTKRNKKQNSKKKT